MSSPEYRALLDAAWDLHVRKNAGYAGADNPDPWANFRMSEAFGISALDGCLVRLSDKYLRMTNLLKSLENEQVGESLRDTLQDLAAYAFIAICLLDEQTPVAKDVSLQTKLEEFGLKVGVPLGFPSKELCACHTPGIPVGDEHIKATIGPDLYEAGKRDDDAYEAAVEPWACPAYCCAAPGALSHDGPCRWCPRHDAATHRDPRP